MKMTQVLINILVHHPRDVQVHPNKNVIHSIHAIMIVQCLAMNIAIAFVREISVKNIVAVHQVNATIDFLVVVAVHRVELNNVRAMLQHVNVIRIYVHHVALMIFEQFIMK